MNNAIEKENESKTIEDPMNKKEVQKNAEFNQEISAKKEIGVDSLKDAEKIAEKMTKKIELQEREISEDNKLFVDKTPIEKKVGLFEKWSNIFSSKKRDIESKIQEEKSHLKPVEAPPVTEIAESQEAKSRKQEFLKFLFEDFLSYNKFLNKDILSGWIDLDKKPDLELMKRSAKSGDIAYADGVIITFMEKFFGLNKEGKEYDRKFVSGHEIGHMLEMNNLIHSKEQIKVLNKISSDLGIESLDEEQKKLLSPEMLDIVELFTNPDSSKKETKYIQAMLQKIGNDDEMKKYMDSHNSYFNNKYKNRPDILKNKLLVNIEDARKSFRKDISQEVMADRLACFLIAKEKNPEEMLKEQVMRSPDIGNYLGFNSAEMKKLKDVLKTKTSKNGEQKLSYKEMLEELLTDPDLTMEKDKIEKLTKLFNENQRFFDLFNKQLSDKKPENIKSLLKSSKLSAGEIDDMDDMFNFQGSGIGEGGSIGGGGRSDKGFLALLFELFDSIYKG